jgi:4-amino-4-deoxy-L-arabinose transferase-like glycosyltransferase
LLRLPGLLVATAVFLAVAAPWPLVMLAYDGLDESRKTWFQRFVVYDLLGRVGVGVHGDRGGLEYYVRYLGFGMVPWAGFVPVAAFEGLQAVRQRATDRASAFNVVVVVWFFVVFLFFAATTTKFHHYALPAVVPAALLVGFLLDRLATAGARHWVVVGGFAAITTAIVLRELQASPWEWLDLFTYHYKGYKPEYYFPVDTIDAIAVPGTALTLPLFRVMPVVLGVFAIGAPLLLLAWWLWRGRATAAESLLDVPAGVSRPLITGLVVGAVQVVLARASAHWSQRWLLQTYFDLRQGNEKLIAYQMDWKGETFYSKNHEIQIKKNAADLRLLVAEPGREFVLVQTDRFDGLKAALGKNGESRVTVVDKSNAKWLLVTVD